MADRVSSSDRGLGRLHYGWIVLTLVTLVVFAALGLGRFGYSLLLPSMQEALALDNTGAGGLATGNLVGYLALSALGGALAARHGPRLVASVGVALAGLGMLATGASGSFSSALAWRTVTGIGSGASNVPSMALTSAWFSHRRRGLAAGVAASGSSLAIIVIGPLVPRLLAAAPLNGWRLTWYLFGGFAVLMAIMGWLLQRNSPAEKGLHPIGASKGQAALPAGAAVLRWDRVYRSGAVWHLGAVYAAFGFSYIIYMTFFVRYLVGELGFGQDTAGDLFMLLGWLSLGCGLVWGAFSDRVGRRLALILVYLIHAISFSMFVWWPSLPGVAVSAALFGFTAWSIPAIMAATSGDVVGPRLAPAALGFVTLFFGVGQALGPSLAGAMADASGTFTGGFLLAAAIALIGAAGSSFLKTPASQGERIALETASEERV